MLRMIAPAWIARPWWPLAALCACTLVGLGPAAGEDSQRAAPANPSPADAAASSPATPASDKLPWQKEVRSSAAARSRPISGPREFLARYGIGESQWEGFFSGQALSSAEEEVLVRLLYHFPRFGQENVEAWAIRGITWDQLAAEPQEHRAKIFRLTGRVQRVTPVDLLAEVATRFEFQRYYQVRLRVDAAPYVAVVYCREAPAAWKLDAELDEPASAYGLFLKVGDPSEEPPSLLFSASRIAWHPDRPSPDTKIDRAHVALGRLGVDIGRFQEVGREKGTGILAAEREPFYQILDAVADERAAEILHADGAALDVVPLLQQPEKLQGHLLPVRGIARRVARIDVPDADIRQRFGIDHYYEIDLSVPLAQTIRLGADPKKKAEAVVYENSFPATICVREIPPGLRVGDDVRQMVRAEALFFKIWLYQSAYTSPAKLVQPAPLFLARRVQIVQEAAPSRWLSDAIVGTAMVLALLTFVGIAIWFRWSDRSRNRRELQVDSGQPKPDFTNLG